LPQLNEELKGKNWAAGEEFSFMDIAFYHEIRPVLLIVSGEKVNKELLSIKTWMDRVGEQDCVK